MKLSKRLLSVWARTLFFAFLFVLVGKHWHAFTAHTSEHEHSCCHHYHNEDTRTATIYESCAVCDFDFFKTEAATYLYYAPLLSTVQIEQPILYLEVVYKVILFVNAHSPPFSL